MHAFIYSYIFSWSHASVHSLMYLCTHAYIYSCVHSWVNSFTRSFSPTFMYSCIHLSLRSFIYASIHHRFFGTHRMPGTVPGPGYVPVNKRDKNLCRYPYSLVKGDRKASRIYRMWDRGQEVGWVGRCLHLYLINAHGLEPEGWGLIKESGASCSVRNRWG